MAYPKLFRLLWIGQSLSNLADTLYLLSIVTMVYKLTGSALFAALVPLCRVAGQLTCGVAAPLIMDRFRLTSLIKLSQLLQVILFAVLALTALNMASGGIPIVLALIALLSFTDGITTPVRNSLVPLYAGKVALMRANGLMSTTDQTVMMLGWAGGGILVAWIGSSAVIGWTLVMYGGALLLTLRLKEVQPEDSTADEASATGQEMAVEPIQAQPVSKPEEDKESAWDSIKEGWQNIWRNRSLRLLIIMDTIEGTVSATWIGALILVYVTEQLKQGTDWYGMINAGYFAGCIAGGLLVVKFNRRLMARPALSIMTGAGFMGLLTIIYAYVSIPWFAVLLVTIMGPAQVLREVTRRTVFQHACPPDQLPKVMSAENTLVYTLFGLSVLLLSWIADRWGISTVYVLSGCFYVLTACLAIWNRRQLQSGVFTEKAAESESIG